MTILSNSSIFSTITISGTDAKKFLQGQITANLDDLDNLNNQYILSAYCNQQGRVISVFYIFSGNNNYIFLFLGNTAELFLKKIKKYAVFSKITFSAVNYENPDQYFKLIFNNDFNPNQNNIINYLISNKIPIIEQKTAEQFLPDNLNLINLNAVSFKKGCFLGQEIIARMYYKGTTKKKLHLIKIAKTNQQDIYTPGTELKTQLELIAGYLIYAHENLEYLGLAVLEGRFIDQEIFINNNQIVILSCLD